MRRLAQAAAVLLMVLAPIGLLFSANEASASAVYVSPYTFDQTFGSALRLLRVDLGLKITEKDVEGGYVLFEYTSPESGKRVHGGSLEIVRGREQGRVHVAVQLPSLPRYHEQMIIDALAKKLAAEHGEPLERAKPPKDNAPADGGADSSL